MRGERRAVRVYRRFLSLYPEDFRREFEAELVEHLLDDLDAASRRGRFAALRVWIRTLAGLVPAALSERRLATRSSSRARSSKVELRRLLPTLTQELRAAVRTRLHRPLETVALVSVLALGIGASTTLFGIVDHVLLRPLPYADAERLVLLFNRYGEGRAHLSPPDFVDRRDSVSLELVAAYQAPQSRNLVSATATENVAVARVTSRFFDVLGLLPELGTVDLPDETRSTESDDLIVLSHGMWRDRFGGDEGVIGSRVEVHGRPATVIAVMGPDAEFPAHTDAWQPVVFTPDQLADDFRGNEFLVGIGRLARSSSVEAARGEMEAIAARVVETVPDRADFLRGNDWGATTVPLIDELVGPVRTPLRILFAAVLVLLLIACTSVAGVLLASTSRRKAELALRVSLGATRSRVLLQLLMEHVSLAFLGGATGVAIAWLATRALPRFVPYDDSRLDRVVVDARVLAFAAVVSLLCVLVFGLAPALRGAKECLRGSMSAAKHRREVRLTRRVLVVAQISATLVLLVGAGLLLRSLAALEAVDLGFSTEQRLSLRLSLPNESYEDAAALSGFEAELLERLGALPWVASAAASDSVPLDGRTWTGTFYVRGRLPAPGAPTDGAELNIVSEDYFAALGIPLREGRGFELSDLAKTGRVAVVDERVAEHFWPGSSAIGQHVQFGREAPPERAYEIVGVAGHVTRSSLGESGGMQIYLSSHQLPNRDLAVTVASRLGDPEAAIASLRSEVARIDPALPVHAVRTLDDALDDVLAGDRFNFLLLGGFAAVALVLAALGLYGVIAGAVANRVQEVGLRKALGATESAILLQVLREGLKLTFVGVALGLVMALGAVRLLRRALYGVEPYDPLTLVLVVVLIGVVAIGATLLPARRAARLEPTVALRAD